jgi:hypothetical protein
MMLLSRILHHNSSDGGWGENGNNVFCNDGNLALNAVSFNKTDFNRISASSAVGGRRRLQQGEADRLTSDGNGGI